jgi:hypothetical protein
LSAVVDAMAREIRPRLGVQADLDWQAVAKRAAIKSKSVKMLSCISQIRGFVCGDCGTPAEGAAGLTGLTDAERCHARSCPRCARIKAAELREWGGRLQDNIATMFKACKAEKTNYRTRFVTLTTAHNPTDAHDHTVEKLAARVAGLRAAFSAIWRSEVDRVLGFDVWCERVVPRNLVRKYRKDRRLGVDPVTGGERVLVKDPERVAENLHRAAFLGAWGFVELAGSGHVHLHVLYFGPWVNLHAEPSPFGVTEPGWVEIGQRAFPELGEISDVRIADGNAVGELAKYPLKIPGGASVQWLAGEPLENPDGGPGLIHPVLAARWEIALHGQRVSEKYGSFRAVGGAPPPLDAEAPPTALCSCCGAVSWQVKHFEIVLWLRLCEIKNIERPLGNPRAREKRAQK